MITLYWSTLVYVAVLILYLSKIWHLHQLRKLGYLNAYNYDYDITYTFLLLVLTSFWAGKFWL